jgi:D-xylose transport system substrate-binding protein
MKFRIALVVFSCLLSVLTGALLYKGSAQAGGEAAGKKKALIGFSLDTLKEARWQRDKDYFTSRVKELGADVLVQAANSDDTRQMMDVEALISRGVNVLVIAPHNGKAMSKAVKLAHNAGIPVIAYDRLIMDSDVDLYVTFDGFLVGQLQAKYLVGELLKNKPKARVVRIYGSKNDHNAFLFKEGQDDVLAPYIKDGRIEVVHEDWADDWSPENAKKILTSAITRSGRDIDGVLASNDGTAGGAIQALTEEGLAGKVVVTGQDAELIACQRVIGGTQAMTVYKPIKKLAGAAAEAAVNMASGKPVIASSVVDNGKKKVPSVLIDSVVVTKENMDGTVVAEDFHSKRDIYGEGK